MSSSPEKFTFPKSNGQELAARLDMPIGNPQSYALFAHCFTCTKDIFAANRIAKGLTDHGIAVLRFDFTGLGASEGEFANTNFTSNVEDLVAAADHMRKTLNAPEIIIGHSLGGAAVLSAAKHIPESKAVITIGAPADPSHVVHNFEGSIKEIEDTGEAEVLLVGRPFRIQKQFINDVKEQNLKKDIETLKKALLVFHAPFDQTVGIENAADIYNAAKHPKSSISLDDADHLLTKRIDADYVADVIASWVDRYIGNSNAKSPNLPNAKKDTVVVGETGDGKFTNVVVTGSGHIISADEPEPVGGDNSGPTPYDFLLAALGACKSMTMRMYANHKGFKLDRAEVRLSHSKIHAEDCAECETKKGKVDHIETEINITGDLTEEERQKIFEIAEKCPVHKTITGEIIIDTTLKD
ncbi:MAG: bifunctional alpha/beta hydrolase/OsmC family protein [Emcibacteraceae bacterium]|nr:bifunctional alpha/beta hydrolase/OsmC family protein [Emcibacteraceae bacterium]MDG1727096.1 bifunctional alpha/beta hydrolase/OsmC family protein [Emcibacteraceae bacterium]